MSLSLGEVEKLINGKLAEHELAFMNKLEKIVEDYEAKFVTYPTILILDLKTKPKNIKRSWKT